jgi:MoaA/NifB/PqqE/SkfB family radical SAM enzyme
MKTSLYCKIPWETIYIDMGGEIYNCGCSGKVTKSIGNIFDISSSESFWSNFKHNGFKNSILERSYAYCKESVCGNLQNAMLTGSDSIFVKEPDPLFNNKMIIVYLPIDNSCNLACPTCRNEKIINKLNEKHHKAKRILEKVNEFILPNVEIPIFRLCGSGEVFASPALSEWLFNFPYDQYPKARFYIHTNGTLLHKYEEWLQKHQLRFHGFEVSIDAATKETYQKTRVGGNWENLQAGLEILKTIKVRGQLRYSFVISRHNYQEINQFVEFARERNVKAISFYSIQRWDHFNDEQWKRENIFNPSHELYPDLINELKNFPWDLNNIDHNLHYLRSQVYNPKVENKKETIQLFVDKLISNKNISDYEKKQVLEEMLTDMIDLYDSGTVQVAASSLIEKKFIPKVIN